MSGVCTQCGGRVIWRREGGKLQCFNADGATIHWDTCSKRRFERIKATGRLFEEDRAIEAVAGYKTKLKKSGEQLFRCAAKSIRGPAFKESGDCGQCVAPWEVCPRPCPNAIGRRADVTARQP